MSVSSIPGGGGHCGPERSHRGGLERMVAGLANDDGDEAKAIKSAFEKLEADRAADGADPATLRADRRALHEAMKAYRAKHGEAEGPPPGPPPGGPPPGGPGGLAGLIGRLAHDDSEEATKVKSAMKQFLDDHEAGNQDAVDADANALRDALKAFIERVRGLGASQEPGQLCDRRA